MTVTGLTARNGEWTGHGGLLKGRRSPYSPDAIRILRDALRDANLYVCANAVEGLVELAGLEAEPWISPLARDPAPLVRDTVAAALEMERHAGVAFDGI